MRRLPRSILWLAALCTAWVLFMVVASIRRLLANDAPFQFRETQELVATLQESLEVNVASLPRSLIHVLWIVPLVGLAGLALRMYQQRSRSKRS